VIFSDIATLAREDIRHKILLHVSINSYTFNMQAGRWLNYVTTFFTTKRAI